MYTIDNENAVLVMPEPGAPGPRVNGYFQYNTPVSQAWINSVQKEYANVVTGAGFSLDKANFGQLLEAINQIIAITTVRDGINAIIEDLNPRLGGDLYLNEHDIISLSNGNIQISADGTGHIELDASEILIGSDLVHRGDIDNLIRFGANTFSFQTGAVSRLDITSAGVRLASSNSRVTTILNEDDMVSDSNTALFTQQSAKSYADTLGAPVVPQMLSSYRWLLANTLPQTYQGWIGAPAANIGVESEITLRSGGVIKNLYVGGIWNNGETTLSNNITGIIQINGIDTSITANLTNTIRSASDLLHSVTVNAGDKLGIKVVTDSAMSTGTGLAFQMVYSVLLT